VLLILWPIPLYISGYVFNKPFFTGWVVAGLIWLFFSLGCVGIFPLWESRNCLMRILKASCSTSAQPGRLQTWEEIQNDRTTLRVSIYRLILNHAPPKGNYNRLELVSQRGLVLHESRAYDFEQLTYFHQRARKYCIDRNVFQASEKR
jgi:hypothetical protein